MSPIFTAIFGAMLAFVGAFFIGLFVAATFTPPDHNAPSMTPQQTHAVRSALFALGVSIVYLACRM